MAFVNISTRGRNRTMETSGPSSLLVLGLAVALAVGLLPSRAVGQEQDDSAHPATTEEMTVTSGGQTDPAASSSSREEPSPALALPPGAEAGAEDLEIVYNRKLRTIEERVNMLKEKVFRSKTRLLLLRETVLHGVVSGAKAVLYHVNELGASYTLESVSYFLDGSKIYTRADASGDLSKKDEIKIFEGNIRPGNHEVTVNLVLRGNGFGVFSYLNSYKFRVQHSYNFIAEEGKVSRLRIISYEKNGLMRDFKDRPNIRYDLVTDRNLPSSSESSEKP